MGLVVHVYNLSTWQAEAGEFKISLWDSRVSETVSKLNNKKVHEQSYLFRPFFVSTTLQKP